MFTSLTETLVQVDLVSCADGHSSRNINFITRQEIFQKPEASREHF